MVEQFHRPATVREALALKRRLRRRAAFLAGGTWVNSSDSGLRPTHLISLAGLGLDRIEARRGRVVIGALCTLQRLIEDRRVPAVLRAAAGQVVSRNVREAATLGGHVAANLPWSDLIPMLVALEARLVLSRPGANRTLPVAEYAVRPAPGLITQLVVPKPKAGRVAVCRNFRASANARSVASAAVSATFARGKGRSPIVALGGVARSVVRLPAVERALRGRALPALDELQALAARTLRPADSLAGSAAFRRYQAGATVALACRDAFAAGGARP